MRGLLAGRPPSLGQTLAIGIVCAALVFGLRVYLEWVGPLPGDGWVRMHHDSVWLQPTAVLDLSTFFSVVGTPAVAAMTVAVALIYAARAEGWRGVLLVVIATAGVVANGALKELSGPTPLMQALGGAGGLNYPSGHTVYATATFGALALLARRAGRLDVALPLLALIALMGPFRVIATAHFVSDVIAGYLVGFAWLCLAATVALRPARGS